MKKLFFLFLVLSAVVFSNCNKTSSNGCKGGGWYGDRNLGTIEVPVDTIQSTRTVLEEQPLGLPFKLWLYGATEEVEEPIVLKEDIESK